MGDSPSDLSPPGIPGWVKVFGIILIVAIAVGVIVALAGGGGHGPGRHGAAYLGSLTPLMQLIP